MEIYAVRQYAVTVTDLIMGEIHTQSVSYIAERVQQWAEELHPSESVEVLSWCAHARSRQGLTTPADVLEEEYERKVSQS